ncbi:MYND-type domain-containing protein [Favolaschia claudopus]|uniref:MYND-type domain-containing protein n=1 Tax=Favolaschia claudopus TaxID=2862362 RepID=A0AAW0B703_9AGAR
MRIQVAGVVSFAVLVAATSAGGRDEFLNRGEETPFLHDDYRSGRVHERLMNKMIAAVARMRVNRQNGSPPVGITPIAKFTPCIDGYANTEVNNTYACRNLDLYSFTPHGELGSEDKIGNDIWGWTHTSGGVTREFGLVAQMDGTAFVEVLPSGRIVVSSLWRDIKVIGNHAYIGSEAEGHGIQVFDLFKLLDVSLIASPKTFSIHSDLTGLYNGLPVGRSHNVVAHAARNLIVAVGSNPRTDICASGLIFIDVSDPSEPTSAGCAAADGYVHDAQCLVYYGPDAKYNGTDICYGYNEKSLTIYNVTDLADPRIISITPYYGVSYAHQGWVVDEKDQRYLLLNDEDDEVNRSGWAADQKTVTYIWDISDLAHPVLTGHYKSPAVAIDHNLYIHDGLCYESNYNSGLRIVDISSINEDPTGAGFFEAAFFDVHPEDDDINGIAEYGGSWSVYPFFESGYVLVNTMERGLFVVKYTGSV